MPFPGTWNPRVECVADFFIAVSSIEKIFQGLFTRILVERRLGKGERAAQETMIDLAEHS